MRPRPSCPKFKNWRPPSLPFSFKSAINREYGTFFAIIATFTVLELLGGLFNSGKLMLDAIWVKLFIFSASSLPDDKVSEEKDQGVGHG